MASHPPRDAGRGAGLLLLLPTLVLAWPGPGSVLDGVFAATVPTAAGAALLASLPLALVALRRGAARPRGVALLLPALLLAVAGDLVPGRAVHDTLEASRASWILIAAALAALAGASAGETERRRFLRGTLVVTLALTLWALFGPSRVALVGTLGNTGELASAALLGGVIGGRALVLERGAWRLVGGAALLAFAAQAAAAPSIANVLAFLAGSVVAALVEPLPAARRTAVLAVALLPLAALLALRLAPDAPRPEGAPEPDASVLGGVGVRASLAGATLELIGDAPFLGVGPGQFAVAFPPYRRLEEIEASSDRADPRFSTEVEHPHQDALLALAEDGLLAGGALVAFWLLAALAALRTLRDADSERRTLAAGLLAVLAGSLVNAPLATNPAALVPAYGVMGMLLAGDARRGDRARFALPVGLLALGLFAAPRALAAVRHGRALASIAAAGEPDLADYQAGIAEALAACPDSVVAASLAARLPDLEGAGPRAAIDAWRRVLELRPNRIEALLETARHHARLDEYAEAEALLERVLELDAENPIALRNLVRARLHAGRLEVAERDLERLDALGLLDAALLESLVGGLLLDGLDREARLVLPRLAPELADVDGDRAWVEAERRRAAGETRLADAFESLAHQLWARALAERGNASRAIAVYRQSLRVSREYVEGGARRVRLELCAAERLAGRTESAARTAEGLTLRAADRAALPEWAGEALRASGLFP